MNKIDDEYIDKLNIISKQYVDRICDGENKSQIIREQLLCIEDLQNSKNNLIKYLEDKIKIEKEAKEFTDKVLQESSAYESGSIDAYQDILERVKSGNYEI